MEMICCIDLMVVLLFVDILVLVISMLDKLFMFGYRLVVVIYFVVLRLCVFD